MPQVAKKNTGSRPKGYLLTSTACILAVVTFCAGLLVGHIFSTRQWGSPNPAETKVPIALPGLNSTPAPQLAEHIAEARRAAENSPQDAAAWTHLGNLYFDAGQSQEAIAAYEKSLALSPGNPDVLTDLGSMYRAAGQPQEALRRLDAALAAQPLHRNAMFNRGLILALDLGRVADGIAAWKELLSHYPDASTGNGTPLSQAMAPLALDAAGRLAGQNRIEEALAACDLALAEQPDFAPAMERKAELMQRLGGDSRQPGRTE